MLPVYNLLKFKGFCASGEVGTYFGSDLGWNKGDTRNAIQKETNQNTPKKTNHPGLDMKMLEAPYILPRTRRAASIAKANPT
jgi:hypothetical protein